jgi:hypothetical protein
MPRVSLWRREGIYRVSVYTHNGFGNPPVAILGGFFIGLKWKCGTRLRVTTINKLKWAASAMEAKAEKPER